MRALGRRGSELLREWSLKGFFAASIFDRILRSCSSLGYRNRERLYNRSAPQQEKKQFDQITKTIWVIRPRSYLGQQH